jgi:TldD protein
MRTANLLDSIDDATGARLLSEALGKGGDYADLYFEYRETADYSLDESCIRAVSGGIIVGVGVRVVHGRATGYAYSSDLGEQPMLKAARVAGQVAAHGGTPQTSTFSPVALPDCYRIPTAPFAEPGVDRAALLRRADAAARAYDHRIVRVEGSLSEETRAVVLFTSDGRVARDQQPMIRLQVQAVAEDGGRQQRGGSAEAARGGMEIFLAPEASPEKHGKEAARMAIAMLQAREAPAGQMGSCWRPANPGFFSTRRWATDWRRTSIANALRTTPTG